ncbi:MAG: NAD-dependent DNA ligase LigA, partial [Clostridia bacterium]|nr:NAD-dependent DNA ligase LigA [Clostridia bacterium]
AIGIDGVGKVAAKSLTEHFRSFDLLKSATVEELVQMEDVGEITANGIVEFLKDEATMSEINDLFAQGVTPYIEERAVTEGVFSGESVVLTGTLTKYKRGEAQKKIEALGGVCQSSVTAKTTLVVAGEEAGSKLQKAKKLGIKIIDEAEFLRLLGE